MLILFRLFFVAVDVGVGDGDGDGDGTGDGALHCALVIDALCIDFSGLFSVASSSFLLSHLFFALSLAFSTLSGELYAHGCNSSQSWTR